MIAEREEFINAAPYERTSDRKNFLNEFKNKKLLTRTGELNLKVPQVRSSDIKRENHKEAKNPHVSL